jgi:glycosyltransferase involved in cell wall biosynthesis
MSSLSVVIISYRNPTYLDLCLRSVFENKACKDTEVVCVLDGYAEESAHVVEKYPDLNLLALEENKGQTFCHNNGVINASGDYILVLNDDNVVSCRFDDILLDVCNPNKVIAPNQVEPAPSIFPDFLIEDFGRTPEQFQYDEFLKFAYSHNEHKWSSVGSTWPLCMSREKYMALGGLDPYYPSPAYADLDFFLRCELMKLSCVRYFGTHIYHFAGASTRTIDKGWNYKEAQSAEYFEYKWKFPPYRNKNNSLYPAYLHYETSRIGSKLPTV